MKVWRIECETEGREVYYVRAETEEDARLQFDSGDMPEPSVAETLHSEITSVEEASE